MSAPDMRWKARLSNFNRALAQLAEADELSRQRPLSSLEKLGLIHEFEFTHELALKTMKDYLSFQGIVDLTGVPDTTRAAVRHDLIADSDGWMMMVTDRTRASHAYGKSTVDEIVARIHVRYMRLFRALAVTFRG